jgi:oxaloacetate decarboxylase gamma subunit
MLMSHIESLLTQAATLMTTGMIVVFLFLTVMVYVVGLMSKLVPKETPPTTVQSGHSAPAQINNKTTVSSQVIAAISAAIHQYRSSPEHE